MKVTSVCLGWVGGILVSGMVLPVMAQVTSDGTTNTVVNQSGNDFTVLNGVDKGNNLFHSFSNFSIPTNGSATFDLVSTPNITTIFSRVTGGNVSSIDGLIRTVNNSSPVSLFLMNPSGIIFGQNASLNIGGSFVGTTANSIKFADGTEFSATNITAQPLLTVSVPIGLQMGQNPGTITHQATNFAVQPRLRLSLIGGDVSVEGGRLIAPSGRIEVGSVGANGTVNLGAGGVVSYPASQPMQNIQFSKAAVITTSGAPGGSIQVQGRQVLMREASSIVSNNNSGENNGGGIYINATELLELTGTTSTEDAATNITARVRAGTGQGSQIDIVTPQLKISDGAQIVSRTEAAGNAGNITIQSNDIEAIGESSPEGNFPSGIISRTEATATGRGGDVTITAQKVQLLNGAEFRASSRGNGNAGNFTVKARELTTNSVGITLNYTGISTSSRGGSGQGGDILLEVDTLKILGGSAIRTGTGGSGRAGNMTIRAKAVTLQGEDADEYTAQLFTQAESATTTGNAGNIQIDTEKLSVLDGAKIYTNTSGSGNAGNLLINAREVEILGTNKALRLPSTIQTAALDTSTGQGGQLTINAERLRVAQGGQVTSTTIGSGNAGNIALNGQSIDVTGISLGGYLVSGIYATNTGSSAQNKLGQEFKSNGNGGVITIRTDKLRVSDGASVRSSTSSAGSAGNINVIAKTVEVTGSGLFTPNNVELPSALSANVELDASGQGGQVHLITDQLRLAAGGQISSSTNGSGNAGNVNIRASQIELVGKSTSGRLVSGLFANATQGTGNGGDIRLITNDLAIVDQATINVSNFDTRFPNMAPGKGAAGEVNITAKTVRLNNASSIIVDSLDSNRGNIMLESDLLLMRWDSLISATARGRSNGGNIKLDVPLIAGFENSDIIANAVQGRGGNIAITTQGIFGLKYQERLTPKPDITASSEFGINGTVNINNFGVNPASGLVELPVELTDPSRQIATGCLNNTRNSFVATGRGGIPQNPNQEIRSDSTWADIRDISTSGKTEFVAAQILEPVEIVQATSWRRNAQRIIELVADTSPVNMQKAWFLRCRTAKKIIVGWL
ncbi:filamentous hemagglutinin-like protein [Calothrix sp. NIES-4071]|nr:filamentous hemagglutinin-like protein [Calothrix sp. NIES-4071]BAZ54420.1 filamentous hemagglutinin-like protein [Calothrix sp. NIES-4105]